MQNTEITIRATEHRNAHEALQHLDPAIVRETGGDLALLGLGADHDVDGLFAVRIDDRGARQLQRVLPALVRDVDAREHARLQVPRGVRHFDAGAKRASLRIDGRADA